MTTNDTYTVTFTRANAAKGGKARAKNLTKKQLSAIGRLGAKVRWKKKRKMVHGGKVAPGKAVAEYKTGSRVESGRVEIGLPSWCKSGDTETAAEPGGESGPCT